MSERPKDGDMLTVRKAIKLAEQYDAERDVHVTLQDYESAMQARNKLEALLNQPVGLCPLARLEEWRKAAPDGHVRNYWHTVSHDGWCEVFLSESIIGGDFTLMLSVMRPCMNPVCPPAYPVYPEAAPTDASRIVRTQLPPADDEPLGPCILAALERIEQELQQGDGT